MDDFIRALGIENTIPIDYQSPDTPTEVKEGHPVLFHDGDKYCCLLGEDPMQGVFGCGDTPGQALTDWANSYRKSKGSR